MIIRILNLAYFHSLSAGLIRIIKLLVKVKNGKTPSFISSNFSNLGAWRSLGCHRHIYNIPLALIGCDAVTDVAKP
jgi:hypothetical protein